MSTRQLGGQDVPSFLRRWWFLALLVLAITIAWPLAAHKFNLRTEVNTDMPEDRWDTIEEEFIVHAKPPAGAWQEALDYVSGPETLRIVAKWEKKGDDPAKLDEWTYAEDHTCTADGDPTGPYRADDCLLKTAPIGALIGRIGGSSAEVHEPGAANGKFKAFVVGSLCVVEIPADTQGPLFLTINDTPTGFADNKGVVRVKISRKKTPHGEQPPPGP